jgi:acyl CoA:acetate/3-ketoacid CoA transferase
MASALEKPVITADEAAALIADSASVAIGGSGAGHSIPERILEAIGRRFRATGQPRDITLIHPFGVGNQKDRGFQHMAYPEMYRRVIGGHWSMSPDMAKLAAQNRFEAYCLPAGVMVQLFHATAAGSPGWITEIGLGTFIDPRVEGGKLNERATEDLVELWHRNGKEYLFYPAPPIDVALIRAAAADTEGNLSMHEEVAPWHNCAMAQAARASAGTVIAQVKRVVPAGSLDPRLVRVPGIFVDRIVVDPDQGMTYEIGYDPALSGESRKPESEFGAFPFSIRKVIARRAAMELQPGAVLNLGFGLPDGVMKVAREQGFAHQVVPTIEQGQIGGIPAEGLEFGAAYNSTAIIETGHQFAFYHGRGVDITFLGFAEVDAAGNVNVSKLDTAIIGTGGFIDISQKARKAVFCGTLAVRGKLAGRPKFVPEVRQITFSGARAQATGQQVLYVTEAAVFRLTDRAVVLEEIAPGLDPDRDLFPQMGFRPAIAENLRAMPAPLFEDALLPMSLFPQFE